MGDKSSAPVPDSQRTIGGACRQCSFMTNHHPACAFVSSGVNDVVHGRAGPAVRLENAMRMIQEGRITPKQAGELLCEADAADEAERAVEPKDARDFGKALDKALPSSMDKRPGEQCKVCGELVPLREPGDDGFYGVGRGPRLDPRGWMLSAFPYVGGMQLEWVYLCQKCGERIANYIAYCCDHPHARSGK